MQTILSLLIVSSENTRRVKLSSGPLRVGRDPSSDILIADPSISRHQFTITRAGDCIVVEMSQGSRYQFIKGGRTAVHLEVFPGEFFELGPYKFELQAQAELPEAEVRSLSADPGGPIALDLAEDIEQIAPRWRATVSVQPEVAEPAKASGESSRFMKIALPAAVLLVGGYLAYDFLNPPPPPASQQDEIGAVPDLLAAVQPIQCKGADVCLARARDLYQVGVQLGDSDSRDLITLYKAAKQLRRASLALGTEPKRIPELPQRAERARHTLDVAFSDVWFRYGRAVAEGRIEGQFATLRTILSLCREDRHQFCDNLERTYQRLGEQLEAKE